MELVQQTREYSCGVHTPAHATATSKAVLDFPVKPAVMLIAHAANNPRLTRAAWIATSVTATPVCLIIGAVV